MMMRSASRADDEARLAVLARRYDGESAQSIADDLGLTRSAVSVITNRIFHDDIRHSGESEAAVREGYPWMA